MNDLDDDLNLDITPLIDVIFMLVIFFIMTMSFTLPVVDVFLPQSTTATQVQKNNNIVICVNKAGDILYKNKKIDKNELIVIIEDTQKPTLELNIDSQSTTQNLIDIADIARKYADGRLIINTNNSKK